MTLRRDTTRRLSDSRSTRPDVDDDWRHEAACTGHVALFDATHEAKSHQLGHDRDAQAVCCRCPVIDACLTAALHQGERNGVWGGLTPDQRRSLSRHHRKESAA